VPQILPREYLRRLRVSQDRGKEPAPTAGRRSTAIRVGGGSGPRSLGCRYAALGRRQFDQVRAQSPAHAVEFRDDDRARRCLTDVHDFAPVFEDVLLRNVDVAA
jgi:hypothetical protein